MTGVQTCGSSDLGADPGVSFAELGAGERMMDQALINLYKLQGKFAWEPK